MAKGVDSPDFDSWLTEKLDALGLDTEVGDPTLNTTKGAGAAENWVPPEYVVLSLRSPDCDYCRPKANVNGGAPRNTEKNGLKPNRCVLQIVE